ncbi:hypothetical protein VNO80_29294 [Phaseolus coccineus]|uniref:Uncharacterized protein n=1 Tax=Phaseolus coccineus TaxID=3886 RepID=A0AAN9QEV3_PHACN
MDVLGGRNNVRMMRMEMIVLRERKLVDILDSNVGDEIRYQAGSVTSLVKGSGPRLKQEKKERAKFTLIKIKPNLEVWLWIYQYILLDIAQTI